MTATLPMISSFHTSSIYNASVVKKKQSLVVSKHRESRSARIKRKSRERPRPPPPGERKAQRKRIVLSNTNALEVLGLEMLTRDNMAASEKAGQVVGLQGVLLDQLRESKAFKTTQNWSLFRQPSTLMRSESVDMGKDFADINASREDQGFGVRTVQKIITGEASSGKSIHLLQAMSMGFLNDWVVLHIPECQDFTNNNFAYAPLEKAENASERAYVQPTLAAELLSRFASSNAAVLSKLKLNHTHDKSIRVQKHTSLKDLAQLGAEDPSQATAIFFALWKELTVPPKETSHKQDRPSVLVTIDGLNHWMGASQYRDSDYKFIHAHQFVIIRHLVNLLFAPQSDALPYGGMVLAATSGSNIPDRPSFDVLVDQLTIMQTHGLKSTDSRLPVSDPYHKVDSRVADLVKDADNTNIVELDGVSKPEAKGLLDYFARSGVLRQRVTDAFVGYQWMLAGSGLIGQLCKYSARLRV